MTPIAFITNLPSGIEEQWLEILQKKLPTEKIVVGANITGCIAEKVTLAIVANPEPIKLTHFPNLNWVQSLWAGVEGMISLKELKNVEIVRLVDPDLSKTMAEAVLTWTLYLHRNIPDYRKQQSQQNWQQLPYVEPGKRHIGILGTGELGIAAINTLKKSGFKISSWSRRQKEINDVEHFAGTQGLAQLLPQIDILVCLLPLTPETHYLLNSETLNLLPDGAQLINFSRGANIDTKALLTLLDNQHISHAVLDVFEQEPLAKDSPLWKHPGVTILPHISAQTNMETASSIVANNIRNYRKTGKVPGAVNKIKGY